MAKGKKPIDFDLLKLFSQLQGSGRILLIVAVCFVGLAVMDRLMIGPYTSQMKYMEAESKAQKESLKRSKRIVSFQSKILTEYSNYKSFLDTGVKSQEEIISALLKKIETIAAQQSVTVTNVRPGDIEEKPNFKVYKTSIDCEGKLGDVLSFIHLLEQSDYLFQVERYTMTPKSKGSEIIKCAFDIVRILIAAEDVSDFDNEIIFDKSASLSSGFSPAPEQSYDFSEIPTASSDRLFSQSPAAEFLGSAAVSEPLPPFNPDDASVSAPSFPDVQ